MHEPDSFKDEWAALLETAQAELLSSPDKISCPEFQRVAVRLDELNWHFLRLQESYRVCTQEKQALEASSQMMGEFFSESAVGNLVLTRQGVVVAANAAAAELFRVDSQRMIGLGLFGFVAADHIGALAHAINSVSRNNQRSSVDVKCVRPGGEIFWTRLDIVRAQQVKGSESHVLCSIVDITSVQILDDAIRKAEVGLSASTGTSFFRQVAEFLVTHPTIDHAVVSLKEEDSRFRVLGLASHTSVPRDLCYEHEVQESLKGTDESPEAGAATQIADSSGAPQVKNRSPLQCAFHSNDELFLFLYNGRQQIIGELSIHTNSKFQDPKLFSSILKVLSSRTSAELHRRRADDDQRSHQTQLQELVAKRTQELRRKNDRLSREIEKRKLIEERLREAKAQAEQATRIKSAFLANMSHEIRTPMNGIVGITTLLDTLDLPQTAKGYVSTIRSSGESLMRIINDILDFSKFESGKTEIEIKDFSLAELLRESCQAHAVATRAKGLFLFLDYHHDVPDWVSSDAVRVRQVVDNLISNAIKFTEEGCIIVEVGWSVGRKRLEIRVKDTGIGMTSDQLGIVFQRFSQADSSTTRKYGGTGLGLPICKKIASLLQGDVVCQSTFGEGSTFCFSFVHEVSKRQEKRTEGRPKWGNLSFLVAFAENDLEARVVAALKRKGVKAERLFHSDRLKLQKRKGAPQIQNLITEPALLADCAEVVSAQGMKVFCVGGAHSGGEFTQDFFNVAPLDCFFSVECILSKSKRELGSPKRAPVGGPPPIERSFEGLRVLVAEDNDVNRIVVSQMLDALGAVVTMVCNGKEAVDCALQHEYDVVFMDCLMPVMDGFQALAEIRKAGPCRAPIVALTANAMKGDREKCLAAGFDEYVSKPIRLDELKTICAWSLQQGGCCETALRALAAPEKPVLRPRETEPSFPLRQAH